MAINFDPLIYILPQSQWLGSCSISLFSVLSSLPLISTPVFCMWLIWSRPSGMSGLAWDTQTVLESPDRIRAWRENVSESLSHTSKHMQKKGRWNATSPLLKKISLKAQNQQWINSTHKYLSDISYSDLWCLKKHWNISMSNLVHWVILWILYITPTQSCKLVHQMWAENSPQ